MLDAKVLIRIEGADHEKLVVAAKKQKISPSTLARIFVLAGLSKFDGQAEEMLSKLDAISQALLQLKELSAASVAGVALLDIARYKTSDIAVLRENLELIFGLGDVVGKGRAIGQFSKKE